MTFFHAGSVAAAFLIGALVVVFVVVGRVDAEAVPDVDVRLDDVTLGADADELLSVFLAKPYKAAAVADAKVAAATARLVLDGCEIGLPGISTGT